MFNLQPYNPTFKNSIDMIDQDSVEACGLLPVEQVCHCTDESVVTWEWKALLALAFK